MKRLPVLLLCIALLAGLFGCRVDAPVDGDELQMQHSGVEIEAEDSTDETPSAELEPSEEPTVESTEATTEAPETTEPTEPPHSHSYSTSTVAATCSAQGYTLHTCSCSDSYTDNYTAALGHAYTDTVVPPTTEAGGYTLHTCDRCGYSYTDSYTEQLWWDTEEKVAQICAEANAYIASIGCTVEPTAGCWDAPIYSREYQMTESRMRSLIWEGIDARISLQGLTRLYVTYEQHLDGWWIIVKYAI